MLSCIDLTQKIYTVTPQQMSQCRLPMIWFCEMANAVAGVNGKLLKYWHLIDQSNHTCNMDPHLYGNKIGRFAQGMLGRTTGAVTIHFIPRVDEPREWTKDIM